MLAVSLKPVHDVETLSISSSRRQFIKTCAASGALLGAGDLWWGRLLPRLSAADLAFDSDTVRFTPEMEPLVRLLEDTPRSRLLEEMAGRIKSGTTYREVLSALFLAGIRNIQPRPVGFKFHAVLVVNSAHLASRNAPDSDRWLPIFWALDTFKSSQARDAAQGDWTLPAVEEPLVPVADRAKALFVEGMDQWDESKADVAIAGLARSTGERELFDLFCRYGTRDFRDIGHKAIYVANGWRTLQTIGWQHAEPVLRSLAYALLEREGGNPLVNDYEVDRPGRANWEKHHAIRGDWRPGENRPGAAKELLAVLRQGDWQEASEAVVTLLNQGAGPQSIWDGLFQHAAEMMMRRPGIIALHACTSTNAIHYLYRHTSSDGMRRFLLLQNAAFLTLFRRAGAIGEGISIDSFPPVEETPGLEEVFNGVGKNRIQASRKTLAFLERAEDPQPFLDAARRLVYLKSRDSHDYKFSSAMFEDYRHLSPGLRNRFLAASVSGIHGSELSDNPLVARTRAAFA